MNKQITFITGNSYKFNIAKKALENSGIDLIQEKFETPEIQSENVEDVASYSAKWASDQLGKPVIVTDFGMYIEALKGFPGPFIKYVNHWLNSEDILKLMEGKDNRKCTAKDCLAYCKPGEDPKIFVEENIGIITTSLGKPLYRNFTIDQIYIPPGFEQVQSEIPDEQMLGFWSSSEIWHKLADYINKTSP